MQQWFKSSAFTLWLVLAVALAVYFPGPASPGGFLQPELSTKFGVWVIFLLLGLSLPLRQLSAGYQPLRLQAFVLAWNYLGFPLLVGCGLLLLGPWVPADFKLGFALLAIMPTTIASAVSFTRLSGGHVANALVATVLSNVLAVLVVPLLCVLYLRVGAAVSIPVLPLFIQIGALILFPLILGQVVRRLFTELARAVSARTKPISQAIILFIVHAAFAQSISGGELGQVSLAALAALLAAVLLLLLGASLLCWWTAGLLRLECERRIAALYCASQKSIATGWPLATAVLAVWPHPIDAAFALIPLVLYHPLQLLLAGTLVSRLRAMSLAAHSPG
jgi:sodium/bile acid cotransporter 7